MNEYLYPVIFGVVVGTVTRISMLKTDYRQYPTYLHGKIIHIALGFIAASLGTIAVPAILEEEYTAITFLTVAASQFREVRNMERNTLTELDSYELVSRGKAYIEGIALTFESRNYLVIFTSLLSTFAYVIFGIGIATIVAVICFFITHRMMKGNKIGDIVHVEYQPLHFEGAGLHVDDIYIMNIGLPSKQEIILEYGMGFVLTPKNLNALTTISNLGQRQAIIHDVSTALGVHRDSGEPSLYPLAKRDLIDGRLGVFLIPHEQDREKAERVIKACPTLENAIRMPSERHLDQKGRERA
ncbi:YIEGIA family protein [Bacillus fonticola]|uniref:YIEGIA family protein n=1 Tax=Bacillus fonticola TaxID=2728853 RepID=UPI0014757B14|nr:YIEGIA family protein [Bacillus fonticola]